MTDEDRQAMDENLRDLLSAPVEAGRELSQAGSGA
jgi:hypothetical protein